MDKQLIERIALEAMRSIAADEDADLAEIVDDMEDEDKRVMVEFCARFLARIDAERGKSAVAVVEHEEPGAPITWKRAQLNYAGLKLQHGTKLFLSQTTPEGWALGSIEPTASARKVLAEIEAGEYSSDTKMWKDLIAAAQGERNAD